MLTLTTLTVKNCFHKEAGNFNVYRAYYSDETSLLISKNDAERLAKAYNIRIESD